MWPRNAVLGAAALALLLTPALSPGQSRGHPGRAQQNPDTVRVIPDRVPPPPPGVRLSRPKPPPHPLAGRRFHVSGGVALFQGGGQWDRALREAGFGDTHHIEGGWFFSGRDERYPNHNVAGNDELYFIDVSVGLKRWLATGLSVKWNEPFRGLAGFRADAGTGNAEGTFITVGPAIRSYSALLILTTRRGAFLSAGAGPSLTFANIEGHLRYDDGTPSRSFSIDDTKLGFTVSGSLELPAGIVRFGLEGQYNYVGSVDLTAEDTGDPGFPTTSFGFSHSYFGLSVGIRL